MPYATKEEREESNDVKTSNKNDDSQKEERNREKKAHDDARNKGHETPNETYVQDDANKTR